MSLTIQAPHANMNAYEIGDDETRKNKVSDKGTIYAGDLQFAQTTGNAASDKKQSARKQAMKLIRDAWDSDNKAVSQRDQIAQQKEEKLKEELPVIEVTSAAEKNTPQVVVSNESFVEEKSEAKKEEPKTENMKSQAEKATSAEIKSDAKVVIKVNKEAWIEAKSPTKLYLSKVVQGGFTYNVPEEEGMIISIGRYDAADVYVNGKLTPVFTANKKTGISVDDLLKAANH